MATTHILSLPVRHTPCNDSGSGQALCTDTDELQKRGLLTSDIPWSELSHKFWPRDHGCAKIRVDALPDCDLRHDLMADGIAYIFTTRTNFN
jgi:hypothetical protein